MTNEPPTDAALFYGTPVEVVREMHDESGTGRNYSVELADRETHCYAHAH